MFETLAGYLEVMVTPEQRAVCLDACQTLVDVGITEHSFLIEQELAVAEQLDGDFLQHLVEETIKPIYRNILGEFGVRVNDTATLASLVDVLKAVHAIDNYDDHEAVNAQCHTTEGPVAALADILELTGAHHSTHYLGVLDYVSPSLIDRIAELSHVESAENLPPVEIIDHCRTRLRKLLESSAAQVVPKLLILSALENGARLGIKFDLLITPFRESMERMAPPQFAVEILAFALASGLEDNVLRTQISAQMDHFHLDMPKVTAIDVAINKLLPQVTHA